MKLAFEHRQHRARESAPPPCGFALLELLVVSAVIALLASLLLPAVSRAKEKARDVRCRSNQRQIALNFRMALDGATPEARNELFWGTASWWTTSFAPDEGLRMCPDAPRRRQPAHLGIGIGWLGTAASAWLMTTNDQPVPAGQASDAIPGLAAGGFALNGWFTCPAELTSEWSLSREYFRAEANVTQPLLTPIASDATFPFVWPRATDWLPVNLYYGARAMNGGIAALSEMQLVSIARHGQRIAAPPGNFDPRQPLRGSINVAFFDGHVDSVRLERLWQLSWNHEYQPPEKRPGLK